SVLEASPVAMAVLGFMATKTEWEGTVSALLEALGAVVSETIRKDKKQWPRTPRGLRARLDRLLPEFRRVGWRLDFYQEGHDRTRKVCIRPSAPSAASAEAESHGNPADGCADGRETEGPQPSADRPHASARNAGDADGADGADGCAGRQGGRT